MPTFPPQDAPARRALIEDMREDKRGWLQHGIAALAVSLLGLGVAGSMVLTGHAESTQITAPRSQVTKNPAVAVPSAFDRDLQTTSRSSGRTALDAARLKSLADQRAEELSKTDAQIAEAAKVKAAGAREKSLESTSESTEKKGSQLVKGKSAAPAAADTSNTTNAATAAPPAKSSKSCLPVTTGYSVAARFGQVGSWARYHTGFDFAAPVGTPLHAPSNGVVTNAGSGPASGWAGNYVAIKYADGTSSLMAHMSTVSVSVGQTVSACQLVGAIGMTGRTFGPHVHFEIYPAGVTPGDVYKAVNPVPWLNAHGLKP